MSLLVLRLGFCGRGFSGWASHNAELETRRPSLEGTLRKHITRSCGLCAGEVSLRAAVAAESFTNAADFVVLLTLSRVGVAAFTVITSLSASLEATYGDKMWIVGAEPLATLLPDCGGRVPRINPRRLDFHYHILLGRRDGALAQLCWYIESGVDVASFDLALKLINGTSVALLDQRLRGKRSNCTARLECSDLVVVPAQVEEVRRTLRQVGGSVAELKPAREADLSAREPVVLRASVTVVGMAECSMGRVRDVIGAACSVGTGKWELSQLRDRLASADAPELLPKLKAAPQFPLCLTRSEVVVEETADEQRHGRVVEADGTPTSPPNATLPPRALKAESAERTPPPPSSSSSSSSSSESSSTSPSSTTTGTTSPSTSTPKSTTTSTKATATTAALVPHEHVFGNFRNYYQFNPVDQRLALFDEAAWRSLICDSTAKSSSGRPFTYLDIGCNQGELTLAMHQALSQRLLTSNHTCVKTRGVDLDQVLIERAQKDIAAQHSDVSFSVLDVMAEEEHMQGPVVHDLVTCFSITMWIHINHGDDGLDRFLRSVAAQGRVLLIEPQPWKCYRAARQRLRRKGLMESVEQLRLDVTSERLIPHIRSYLLGPQCGFAKCTHVANTHWERPLLIFSDKKVPALKMETPKS